MIMEMIRAGVAAVAVFLLPGYALLVVSGKRRTVGVVWMLSAAGGLSIAVVPFLLYVATYIGLRLTPTTVAVILLAAGLVCVWDWWERWRHSGRLKFDAVTFLLAVIFLLSLFARLWMVRGLSYPLWTDSYHHTLITQLISDSGFLPDSYEPYAPIDRFTYHFGFHALAAWFHWLSGIPVPRSVVLVGQIVNALAVPTGYLLTWRLFRSREAGLVSALVIGLISHLPALFVNWGRYPQLSGQVLLPVLMVLTLDADEPGATARDWVLTGLVTAGLFLVHTRIFLFYLIFAGLFWGGKLAAAVRRRDAGHVKRMLRTVGVMAGVAAVVSAPWLWRFWRGFGSFVAQEVSHGYNAERDGEYFAWNTRYLFDYGIRRWLLALAAAGGAWGLFALDWGVILILAWVGGVFLLANCYLVGLTPLWSNLISVKQVYLPSAVLIGYLASRLLSLIAAKKSAFPRLYRVLPLLASLGVVLAGVVGLFYTVDLVEPQNGFVRPADLKAMEWIQDNIPQDGLFYICVHFWTPVVAHGLDAGYWIPLLARRETILPPEVYGSDGTAEYIAFINRRAHDLLAAETPARLWEKLREYHVSYVYIGVRKTPLKPETFEGSPDKFRLLYSDGGVKIFQVLP